MASRHIIIGGILFIMHEECYQPMIPIKNEWIQLIFKYVYFVTKMLKRLTNQILVSVKLFSISSE